MTGITKTGGPPGTAIPTKSSTIRRMTPLLTRDQVRQVDRIATETYGLCGLVLMENAGRNAAAIIADEVVMRSAAYLANPVRRVVIFCGTGNNGGDGFVVARHLANSGHVVRAGLAGDASRLSPDAAVNHDICRRMGIDIRPADECPIEPDDLVADALLGTGFTGDVREPLAGLIERINASAKRGLVAIDVPSGLDCDTGVPANAAIRADATVTFVASKVGFARASAAEYVGQVHVADIGAPRAIIDQVIGG